MLKGIGPKLLTLAAVLGLLFTIIEPLGAQTLTTLYTFAGGKDGSGPTAGLVWDGGNLYGTTSYGGQYQGGTVFELASAGKKTVLSSLYPDYGEVPLDAPVVGGSTDFLGIGQEFYLTASAGGHYGCGAIVLASNTGLAMALYSFTGGVDGCSPGGRLLRAGGGAFYGTASGGGSGAGTIFRVAKSGPYFQVNYGVVYTFTGGADGGAPEGTLIVDKQGNLYGTTNGGGAYGLGTVFEINGNGAGETVLYSFKGGADGANPSGDLLRDSKGNFYGTTSGGGAYGLGTVYEVSASGVETVLHSFAGGSDGASPGAGLIKDGNENLYGTTVYGGSGTICNQYQSQIGCGTVFEVSGKGVETVLYSFTGGADGGSPLGKLARDKQGNLYGTAYQGGDIGSSDCSPIGCGVVFELTP
jgi:uncharacterized repeat protein (TIGR03803 family)